MERTEARNSSERLNDDIGDLTTILELHISSFNRHLRVWRA